MTAPGAPGQTVAQALRDTRLRRVLLAFGLFAVVEFAIWVAVLLWAFDSGGAPLAGLVGVAQLLPALMLAPALGALGDRFPRGRALSVAYASEGFAVAVTAALLLVSAPVGVVVAACAVATATVSVARPLHFAVLPQLASTPRGLVGANSASGALEGVGVFVGPLLAGLAAQSHGPWLAMGGSALACCAAALLTSGLRLPTPPRSAATQPAARPADQPASEPAPERESALAAAIAGLRVVARDRPALALLLLVGTSFLVTGSLEVLGVAFADRVLAGGHAVAGVVVGATGLGALAGSALSVTLSSQARLGAAVVAGLAISGLPLLAMGLVHHLAVAVAILALTGAGQAFAVVAGRTLLQRATQDAVLARVFAVQEGVMLAGLAAGAVVAPLLISAGSAATAYFPLGAAVVVMAVTVSPLLRRLDDRAHYRGDVAAALRRVTFLAAMAPPALERLTQAASWRDVPAGVEVVTQGEPGAEFYVVAQGRLSVTVSGRRRSHELTAGAGFGEIALLHEVPRTATVTTEVATRLLVVPRDGFLAAITGSVDGRLVAEKVAAAHLARDAG